MEFKKFIRVKGSQNESMLFKYEPFKLRKNEGFIQLGENKMCEEMADCLVLNSKTGELTLEWSDDLDDGRMNTEWEKITVTLDKTDDELFSILSKGDLISYNKEIYQLLYQVNKNDYTTWIITGYKIIDFKSITHIYLEEFKKYVEYNVRSLINKDNEK